MQTNKSISLNSRNGVVFLGIFGIFWTCCSLTIMIPALLDRQYAGVLFSALFVLPGLIMLGYAATIYYSRARVGKPDITISNSNLRVGEQFTVNLMHTFKRNVQLESIVVQLVFKETATYQQGTDTRTVTHEDIYENFELPGGEYMAGQYIQETFTMQIPPDAMHTLKVRRNRLEWFVRVKADIAKLPDYVDEYELTVLPELAMVK
ncbi:MAG TPA: hypothetical protein PLD25_18130 [Chloroflexota bacterium]|nr:hypothetical protein [Chloroflexota bacterium]HUM70455.1 hypothetical protein [Chloroflexota bacterium]